MKRYFGAHVSAAGGLENALKAACALGINTIQIHPSPPQRWNSSAHPEGAEKNYLSLLPNSGVEKVFFHAIYLINLANPDEKNFHLSKLSLVNNLDLASRIGAEGVIFHVGSMKDQADEAEGYDRVVSGINWIFENSKNDARLILEVAAGSGSVIGDRMEELRVIYDQVDNKDRLGFGLDTQHMWASGYDFVGNLEGVVSEIESVFGYDKVWSVHLNDSKTALGSRKDRHENLGDGLIGTDPLKGFFMHPKLAKVPFIMETPALGTPEGAALEVAKLRGYLG